MMVDGDSSTKPGTPGRPLANPSPPIILSRTQKFNQVADEVAKKHNLSVDLILSKHRMWYIVDAKNELAYELRKRFGWSLVIIARLVKARDHTVVRHRIVQHATIKRLPLPHGVTRGIRKRTATKRRLNYNR